MRKKRASNRKEKELKPLQESEAWLRLIMENTSNGIVITEYDPKTDNRRLVLCNDRYVEMSGRSREELMRSEDLNEFLRWKAAPDGLLRDHFLDGALPDGVRLEGTASWLRPDGKDNCYEWTATHLKIGEKYHIIGIDHDITEQRRVEDALRASELQYQTTLNSISDAIHVVDKDLRIVLCNPALVQWCRQLGLESDLVGLTVFEAFPFLPEEVRDEYHNVFQTGETLVREETTTLDDEAFDTETRKIPIIEKGKVVQIVTILRNITERKKSEDRLRRLAMIAEQAVEGIGMADLDGILQFVNPSWARMHGYETGEELVGEHISVFHTSEQIKTYVNQFNEKVKRNGRYMGESEQMRKDGTTFPSEMAITLFKDEEGEPVGMLAFAIDITERKKAEETLRESEYDLRMRVRELNCLYDITEVVNKYNDSLESLLQGIVNVLPHACQRPKTACARITVSDKEYRTSNFRKSQTKLATDILVAGEKIGVVEIFCLKANLSVDKNPFLKEEKYLIDTIAARIGRNIERIQARRQLLAEQSALEQKNIALREIMAGIQDEKKEFGRRIVGNIEKIVMPLLHTLEHELPKGQRKYLDLLKETIKDITLPFADSLSKEFTSLTPTEIRICNLIRKDMSTKQIADLYHISSATVNKHREHIRRKLQITNTDVNLSTYLENYMSSHAEN